MDAKVEEVTGHPKWVPELRPDGKVEIGVNFTHEETGRRTFDAVSPERFLELSHKGLLRHQEEGKPWPEHLPTQGQVVEFLEGKIVPKKKRSQATPQQNSSAPVKPDRVEKTEEVTVVTVPRDSVFAELVKKPVIPEPTPVNPTLDWQKVAAEAKADARYVRPYKKTEVDAVVFVRDELSMRWYDIGKEFGRSDAWAKKVYQLRNLIEQVWQHVDPALQWEKRLENQEVYSLSFHSSERQAVLLRTILNSHREQPSYHDARAWQKVGTHARRVFESATVLKQTLTPTLSQDLGGITKKKTINEIRQDLEAAQEKITEVQSLLRSWAK
jgi:hypothetical protein